MLFRIYDKEARCFLSSDFFSTQKKALYYAKKLENKDLQIVAYDDEMGFLWERNLGFYINHKGAKVYGTLPV
jgi:hypothetical protein